jgi:hypothetical protein
MKKFGLSLLLVLLALSIQVGRAQFVVLTNTENAYAGSFSTSRNDEITPPLFLGLSSPLIAYREYKAEENRALAVVGSFGAPFGLFFNFNGSGSNTGFDNESGQYLLPGDFIIDYRFYDLKDSGGEFGTFSGKFEFIRSVKVIDEEPRSSVPEGGVSALLLMSALGALAMVRRRLRA